jgi:hypothetical protein
MRRMNQDPKPSLPNPLEPNGDKPRVNLDVLEQRLLNLREEMRLLHARLETLNLFTRLGVKPGQPTSR